MTQKLQPGNMAPLFHVTDHQGKPVSLENYRGRKVLIAFFRYSSCALCNLRIQRFIERYPEWQQQSLDIIAFFESPEINLQTYVGKQNPPFPLIADPSAVIYDKYGVESSEEKMQSTLADPSIKAVIAEVEAAGYTLTREEGSNFHRIPADFLIDENGIIQICHYSQMVTEHLPFEAIDLFAEAGL
ncbi:peroxiredoxin family protein [Paenibacillus sp. UNC451MF]|uniref:peroxiredoxin family protein n=1 Tax=Paenibacillus sp. UNC451MF TaxID=1449063 RepID=UPI00068BAC1A|nr:redoxin domain-containing protein [Paenibacillus sp. UNC451MF]